MMMEYRKLNPTTAYRQGKVTRAHAATLGLRQLLEDPDKCRWNT